MPQSRHLTFESHNDMEMVPLDNDNKNDQIVYERNDNRILEIRKN